MSHGTGAIEGPEFQNSSIQNNNLTADETAAEAETDRPDSSAGEAVERSPAEAPVTVEDEAVADVVEELDQAAADASFYGIDFNILPEDNLVQARLISQENEELIRAIPPDELLEIRQRVDAFIGLLFDVTR